VEPLIVQCSACQSRIRVRNLNLIGQRVNCPKCKAPILIAASVPNQIQVSSLNAGPVDSTALTKDGIVPDGLADALQSASPLPLEGGFSNVDFSEVDELLLKQNAGANQASIDLPGQLTSWATPPAKAAPTEQWNSPATTRSRQYLLIGFMGVASCLLAVLGFVLFLRYYSKTEQTPIAAKPQEAVQPLPPVENQETPAAAEPPGDSDPAEVPATDIPETRVEIAPDPVINEPPSVEPGPDTNSATTDPIGGEAQTPAEQSKSDELPEHLKSIMAVVSRESSFLHQPKLIVPEQPKITEQELNTGAQTGLIVPQARLSEVAEQRTVRGLKFSQKRLVDAISIWNGVVGIPTVINPLSLAAADYDHTQLFDCDLGDSTAAQAVDQFAKTVGLEAVVLENRFWLFNAAPPDDDKLPRQYKVDDLISNAEQEAWLLDFVQQFFPPAKTAVKVVDGKLEYTAGELDKLTWFSIVRVLENWRMQRNLPTQLPNYRPESLRVQFTTPEKISGLKFELSNITSRPQPLGLLLNQQCSAAAMNCWVDWQSLEYMPVRGVKSQSLGSQTLRAMVTHQRPLGNMLSELDADQGIVTLLLDEKSVWLTIRYYYRRVPEIFVIPKLDKPVDTYWRQYLRPLTPIDQQGISQVLIRETPDGQFIIVKCCWPTLDFQ
jgi:hypothetical protein